MLFGCICIYCCLRPVTWAIASVVVVFPAVVFVVVVAAVVAVVGFVVTLYAAVSLVVALFSSVGAVTAADYVVVVVVDKVVVVDEIVVVGGLVGVLDAAPVVLLLEFCFVVVVGSATAVTAVDLAVFLSPPAQVLATAMMKAAMMKAAMMKAAITVSVVVAEFSPSAEHVVVLSSVSLFQFFSSVYLLVDRCAVSGEQFVDYQSTTPPVMANDREYSIVGIFSAVFLQWLCTHVFFVLALLSTQQCL